MLPAALYGQLTQQASFSDPLLQATAAALAASQAAAAAAQAAPTAAAVAAPTAAADSSSACTTPTGSKDTTYTKIFVGGLPYHTTDKTLHDYFKQFGDIEEAVVITDRQTQKSRGYGFVTMKERAEAEKACKDPNPIIDGRKANVNLAYLGAKPRNNVQLAASSALSTLAPQLQLQAQQLAATQLLQSRLGVPSLYTPVASTAATNPMVGGLNAQLNPQLMAAVAQMQQINAAQVAQAQLVQPTAAQTFSQVPGLHAQQAAAAAQQQQQQHQQYYAALQALAQQQQQVVTSVTQPTAAELAAQFAAQSVAAASNGLTYRKDKEKHRYSPY